MEKDQNIDPPVTPFFWQKYKNIFISVALLLVIAVSGWFVFNFFPKKISTTSTKNLTVSDETAGWKTYRNEEYGFEIKLPSDIDIEANADLVRFQKIAQPNELEGLSEGDFFMEIQKTSLKNFRSKNFSNIKETNLNGYVAYEAEDSNSVISPYHPRVLFFTKEDKGLMFAIYNNKGLATSDTVENFINKMLSTFKFIPTQS